MKKKIILIIVLLVFNCAFITLVGQPNNTRDVRGLGDIVITCFSLGWTLIYGLNIFKVNSNPNLNKKDYVKSKDYYRDLLENYSIATLIYIDRYDDDAMKYAVATLLSLVKKRKIKISSGRIEKIDTNTDDLFLTEKYVFDRIHEDEGRVVINSNKRLMYCVKDEINETDLLGRGTSRITIEHWIYVIVPIVFLIYTFIIGKIYLNYFYLVFPFFMLPLHLIISVFIFSLSKSKNTLQRTKHGNEVNEKIEGLKSYITDFSTLKDKFFDDLTLWEDYLIYSVGFGINKKVINEMYDYVRIIKYE